jgi:ABC-type transport system involved in cytochrome c biogenesis ATPase subunit
MRFYVVSHRNRQPPSKALFPCAVLIPDNWDDFSYSTSFDVIVCKNRSSIVMEGTVKILQAKSTKYANDEKSTSVPNEFESLSEIYCSLGQSISYYEDLLKAGPNIYKPYFAALRDCVFDKSIGVLFSDLTGFNTSLLRFSEAAKVFNEADELFTAVKATRNFKFTFECKLPHATNPHGVEFDFSEQPSGLNRMTVLIGRNGTGKTQYLAALARAISGLTIKTDSFRPARPSFSRVIAVSYSVFDDFTRPRSDEKTFSYKYCGVRAPEQKGDEKIKESGSESVHSKSEAHFLSQGELRKRLGESMKIIRELERGQQWRDILAILLECDEIQLAEGFNLQPQRLSLYDRLSSGQRILASVVTEIVAHIMPESLILFDEPELHLHPDVFSALARALDKLLREFDSYTIVATHSPLLLQETVSRQVRIFRREGNTSIISTLGVESFGENLTTITQEVFEASGSKNNFKDYLKSLASEHTYEEVVEMFPLGMPLQARAFLKTLYSDSLPAI